MVFSPESIAISAVSLGLTMAYGIARVVINKKLLQLQTWGIIIPANSGKSTLLQTFINTFGEIETNIIMMDIEQQVYDSSDFSEAQKKELDSLLMSDSHLYEAKMMTYSKQIFDKNSALMKQSNPNKKIVVLASTVGIITNLGIKTYYSFTPSPKLQKIITTVEAEAEPIAINFIKYTVSKINQKMKTNYTFNDFDDLFNNVCLKLNIKN